MNKEEGLQLLQRMLQEGPTDTLDPGMPAAGAQPLQMAQMPRRPDYPGQATIREDRAASTKCLALDFLQSEPPQPPPSGAAAEQRVAQARSAGKQGADDAITSGTSDSASTMDTTATITLEAPRITISAPTGMLVQLLQLIEKIRA